MSRVQAQLRTIRGHWVVVDDGLSRNGTFVNGDRVQGRRRLSDQDSIRAGRTTIVFNARPSLTAATTFSQDLPSKLNLSSAQRRVLVALCRPYKFGSPFAIPATNQAAARCAGDPWRSTSSQSTSPTLAAASTPCSTSLLSRTCS